MEVLEFLDDSGRTMVKRVPEGAECEIKWGAQLIVRESQNAVFFRDGKSLMTFKPGRYVLQTQNIPILTKLVTRFGYGPKSPFRSEVYFLNMKLFRNISWSTRKPIPFQDRDLRMVRLSGEGMFSMRISRPALFLNRMVGTEGLFRREEIEDYLRSIIINRLIDLLGENVESVFDLPRHYDEIGAGAKARLADDFSAAGLELVDFVVDSITPPEEVQKMMDERAGMEAVGDLDSYVRFKAARSMQEAASQGGGGTAGTGVGMGAGVGMGMMIPRMLQESMSSAPAPDRAGADQPEQAGGGADPIEKIKQLKELLDMGAITEDEFNAKKAELLASI
jgi:membrane protease subunit (stomatin/prohibitin family)